MTTFAIAGLIIITATAVAGAVVVAIYATRMATRITSEAMRTTLHRPETPVPWFGPLKEEPEPESQSLDEMFPDEAVFSAEDAFIEQQLRRESDEILDRDSEATEAA